MSSVFDNLKSLSPLAPVYFEMDVLEKYFADPRYLIWYSDYRGTIAIDDEYCDDIDEYDYIKDFGLAYNKNDHTDRAVVVFYDDLTKLPQKSQHHWRAHLIDNQNDYFPNQAFVKNLIYGEWVEDISIYQALHLEMKYINEMCNAMEIPSLFRQDFTYEGEPYSEELKEYHVLLLPTERKYYDFVILLEKMVTSNFNEKTFLFEGKGFRKITKKDDEGKSKGSLTMLIEWLNLNVHGTNGTVEGIIETPLRALIKERQIPAHKIIKNTRSKGFWEKQEQLLINVYTAVRQIRLIFANHPKAKTVEIPDYLFDGKHIRNY